MAVFADIQNAFSARLNTLPSSPSVEWENTKFRPTKGQAYISPTLIPGRSMLRDVEGTKEHPGLLQIDVYVPLHEGTKELTTILDNIYSHFDSVNSLAAGSSTIYIRAISRGRSSREEAWYRGMIEIYFTCYD